MKQTPKKLRSTTNNLENTMADEIPEVEIDPTIPNEHIDDNFPTIPEEKSHNVYIKVFECTNKIFSDQTGLFPFPSSQSFRYIMIVYDYNTNYIFTNNFIMEIIGSFIFHH